jgi:hypothetical protein
VQLDGETKATVAVFKGKVSASGSAGPFEVAEKHSATIKFAHDDVAKSDAAQAEQDTFVVAKNYETDPDDGYDRRQAEYRERYSTTASTATASPYGYGMSDLSYYGNFMMLPGFGNVWQPFFTGGNWSPFLDGAWAFYPGFGYTWVSAYPWGWMPYNYGNWAYALGYGYVWQPGNWNTFNGMPRMLNAPAKLRLPMAPAPAQTSGHAMVMVGMGLTANPAGDGPRRLTINPGSAGIGVPRGSVNHLDRVAKTVEHTARPVAVSTVQPAPAPTAAATDWGARPMPSTGLTGTGTTRKGGSGARP